MNTDCNICNEPGCKESQHLTEHQSKTWGRMKPGEWYRPHQLQTSVQTLKRLHELKLVRRQKGRRKVPYANTWEYGL